MKKSILLIISILMSVVGINAQKFTSKNEYYFVPSAFTIDSKAKLHYFDRYWSGETQQYEGDLSIHILNEDFEEEANFKPKRETFKSYERKQREEIAVLIETEISTGLYNWTGYKDFVSDSDSVYKDSNGAIYYIKRYYKEYKYGKKYPSAGFQRVWDKNYGEEMLNPFTFYYEDKYDGEWKITSEGEERIELKYHSVNNLASNPFSYESENAFYCTQTLFNNDDKYEYIYPKYTFNEKKEERDRDGDGDIDEVYTDVSPTYLGLEIVSEDGNVIASINFEESYSSFGSLKVLIWENKTYMCFYADDYHFYEIDRSTSSIKKVATIKGMRLKPSVAEQNMLVTVEVDENTMKNGGMLFVTDMGGKCVYRQSVRPGEDKMQISTNRFASGLYVVSFDSKGEKREAAKLIVK